MIASEWHRMRRQKISEDYPEVRDLVGVDPLIMYWLIGIPILHTAVAIWVGYTNLLVACLAAVTVGAFCRMRMFNTMHEAIHLSVTKKLKKRGHEHLLLLGEYPAITSYYIYYRFFHLHHHQHIGEQSLQEAYELAAEFGPADGDLLGLHGAHTIKLEHDSEQLNISPRMASKWSRAFHVGIYLPVTGLLSRLPTILMLPFHTLKVLFKSYPDPEVKKSILLGNFQLLLRVGMVVLVSWIGGVNSLVYVLLSDLFLRGFLFHPCLAIWIGFHHSHPDQEVCQPTCSIYGPVMDFYCGGVNYHTEHHDFQSVPVRYLKKLRATAGEHYSELKSYPGALALFKEFMGPAGANWIYACHHELLSDYPSNNADDDTTDQQTENAGASV